MFSKSYNVIQTIKKNVLCKKLCFYFSVALIQEIIFVSFYLGSHFKRLKSLHTFFSRNRLIETKLKYLTWPCQTKAESMGLSLFVFYNQTGESLLSPWVSNSSMIFVPGKALQIWWDGREVERTRTKRCNTHSKRFSKITSSNLIWIFHPIKMLAHFHFTVLFLHSGLSKTFLINIFQTKCRFERIFVKFLKNRFSWTEFFLTSNLLFYSHLKSSLKETARKLKWFINGLPIVRNNNVIDSCWTLS